ncbi:hypothetical protein LJR289_004257 [Pseudoduganella sp. LjRoot289]|uniref:hypothetical protein n=1 Tax=Pseudoduganella sp. LjRoot289 TaxID=3342314 RepID=UPI003ED0355D
MNVDTLSRRWFLCAISYFVVGISLGVFMGASEDHTLFPVHAHINLLGWVAMSLTGLLYRVFPAAAQSVLAVWHFWLFQAAVPLMMAAVAAIYLGHREAGPIAGISSIVVLVSVLLFWWNIFSSRNSKMS